MGASVNRHQAESRDDLRTAMLLELLPLPIALAFAAPWLVLQALPGSQFSLGTWVFLAEILLSPFLLISGFGWMGRGRKVLGTTLLVARALLLLFVLAIGYNASLTCAICAPRTGEMHTFYVSAALWIFAPVASATVLAVMAIGARAYPASGANVP
jgi:hypothetical protein